MKYLVEFDAAGQEARFMAEFSQDASMLDIFKNNGDFHSNTGSAISGIPYDEFMARKLAKDPAIVGDHGLRYCGKFIGLSCLVESTRILTSTGYKPILEITTNDLLWDGVEWVTHAGVVSRGTKQVIYKFGVGATPDHRFLRSDGEWVSWDEIASLDNFKRPIHAKIVTSRTGSLRLRHSTLRRHSEHAAGKVDTLQDVHTTIVQRRWAAAGDAISCSSGSMCERKESSVRELRWARDRDALRVCPDVGRVHKGSVPTRRLHRLAGRSTRQRRALRARQYQADHSSREQCEQTNKQDHRLFRNRRASPPCSAFDESGLRRFSVGAGSCSAVPKRGDVSIGSTRPRSGTPHVEVETFDIMEAGPRNRFTIQGGVIAHNCQYRIGVPKLRLQARVQYGLDRNKHEIRNWQKAYHRAYPGVKRYWGHAIRLAKESGYAETLAGRRFAIHSWSGDDQWKSESSAINFKIQGSGADMTELAIAIMGAKHPEFIYTMSLHDGIFYILDVATEDEAVSKILTARNTLNNLPYPSAWGWEPSIEFPFDASYGPDWGHMREL